jgi:glutaredoxin
VSLLDRLRGVGRGAPRTVTVYTRAGCGLCRRAEELVAAEAAGHAVVHVDVDADPDLQRAYNVRVPVVEVDGVEVAEGQVHPGEVRRALRR